MKIVFRVDSSVIIGSGHVMRCMTLADKLSSEGASIAFVSRRMVGNLCALIEKKGYPVHCIPIDETNMSGENFAGEMSCVWSDIDWEIDALQTETVLMNVQSDWLIVDHYGLDARWEKYVRPHTSKIMVIDDLADRPHDCDVLLDQNLYHNGTVRYDNLVSTGCKKFLGPDYALLRPQFIEALKQKRVRDGNIKRILIFLGGSDPTNETKKGLEAIRLLNRPDINVDVVVGLSNPNKVDIELLASAMPNTRYHCNVSNMALLMTQADLSIGAGGSAMWERCILGLPTITMVIAPNQAETTAAVARIGATINMGWAHDVTVQLLAAKMNMLFEEPGQLREMSKKASSLVSNKMESIVRILKQGK